MDPVKTVAIMQDVLARLNHPIFPLHMDVGWYCHSEDRKLLDSVPTGEQIDTLQKNCQVCALGATFLSACDLYGLTIENPLNKFGEVDLSAEEIKPKLWEILGPRNVALIECAFERVIWFGKEVFNPEERQAAKRFGQQFGKPSERMRAIATNVVANQGHFMP